MEMTDVMETAARCWKAYGNFGVWIGRQLRLLGRHMIVFWLVLVSGFTVILMEVYFRIVLVYYVTVYTVKHSKAVSRSRFIQRLDNFREGAE